VVQSRQSLGTVRQKGDIVIYESNVYPGSTEEVCVHKASTLQVAEAAKVIENTQRDVNIALINELDPGRPPRQ
jgi:UDP-N-acetyl-D-galactosamine dehydrogenase